MGSVLDDKQARISAEDQALRSTGTYVADRPARHEPRDEQMAEDQERLHILVGLQLEELVRIRTALEQLAAKAHVIEIPGWLRRK